MGAQPNLAERGMSVGLKALNRVAASSAIDRLGLRDPAIRLLHGATRTTARTAATAGRTFAAAQRLSRPARQPKARPSDLFDLTPTDEQQMLRDSVREFARPGSGRSPPMPITAAPRRRSCSPRPTSSG